MNKPFTFILPDEPYTNTTDKNYTVECEYTGPRYLLLDIEESNGMVHGAVSQSESLQGLTKQECRIPGHTYVIFDALNNLVAAAFITHSYKHGEVPDYEEDVPGGKYTFKYADGTGVIGQVIFHGGIKYNFQTKNFNTPEYRLHANTREQTFEAFANYAQTIDNALKNNAEYLNKEQIEKLQQHSKWLKEIPTIYANVSHWKIPFPTDIPSLPPV